jgi:hypothetical protein
MLRGICFDFKNSFKKVRKYENVQNWKRKWIKNASQCWWFLLQAQSSLLSHCRHDTDYRNKCRQLEIIQGIHFNTASRRTASWRTSHFLIHNSPRVRVSVGDDLPSTPGHARQLVNGLCCLKFLYKIRGHCAASLSAAAWHARRQTHLRSYGTLRQLSHVTWP